MMDLFDTPKKEDSAFEIVEKIFGNENWKDMLFLDTETTALWGEVIEISLVNMKGIEIYSERINPVNKFIHKSALDTHGITLNAVRGCRYFNNAISDVNLFLGNKFPVIIYNSEFDLKIIRNSFKVSREKFSDFSPLNEEVFFDRDFFCLMKLISKYNGEIGKSDKWLKLKDACKQFNIETSESKLHGSSYDSQLSSKLFVEFAYMVGSHKTKLKIESLRN